MRLALRRTIESPASPRNGVVRKHPDRPQVEPHYGHQYNHKKRLVSYWHQVEEILSFQPRTVLEVGTGSGFVRATLKQEGLQVCSLDVDLRLSPDITGSVRALPLQAKSIDVTVCCQVLEHLPFSDFPGALRELSRVARKGIVISLPDKERHIRVCVATSGRHYVSAVWDHPRPAHRRPSNLHPEHYWEIGCSETGFADVLSVFRSVIAAPVRTYRLFEFPYHRFFIVRL
jgi:ubiquinone/menaquinone biosynthesis C-methylase UbiE